MRCWVVPLLLMLQGCILQPPPSTLVYPEPVQTIPDCEQVVPPSQVARWMEIVAESMELSPDQALLELTGLATPRTTRTDRFRYAMLNQRLDDRAGWIRARDTLRELTQSRSLEVDERRLANMLLSYNQAMINAEARQHQLARELDAAQLARRELEQKIEALTSLEQNISIRKEQAIEQQEAVDSDDAASRAVDDGS